MTRDGIINSGRYTIARSTFCLQTLVRTCLKHRNQKLVNTGGVWSSDFLGACLNLASTPINAANAKWIPSWCIAIWIGCVRINSSSMARFRNPRLIRRFDVSEVRSFHLQELKQSVVESECQDHSCHSWKWFDMQATQKVSVVTAWQMELEITDFFKADFPWRTGAEETSHMIYFDPHSHFRIVLWFFCLHELHHQTYFRKSEVHKEINGRGFLDVPWSFCCGCLQLLPLLLLLLLVVAAAEAGSST